MVIKRIIMTRISILLLSVLLLAACSKPVADKPNVIIILTDDQGSIDVNSYGASDLATPNMDRLVDEGIKFSRFYVASAICSPSRAAILSGLTPQSAGVPGNVSSQPGKPGMPSEITTIAEIFRDKGYETGHVGKWHLGYSEDTSPLSQGFNYSFGHMGGCIDNYSHFFYWNGPNRHDLWENGSEIYRDGKYFPDLMGEKAKEFISKNRKKPFLLYYAINTPHYPLQPRNEWREYYSDLDMPRRDYAGFVSTADQNIGRIIDQLEKLKIRDNTIIVFLSDHGHSYETRTFGGGGNAGPFRGGKTSLFEGGIRVPAIISWPIKLKEGKVNNQVAHSTDIVPTLVAMCGISDQAYNFDGIDLSESMLSGSNIKERVLYWKLGSQWAVRKGKWKLIGLPKDPSNKAKLDPLNDRLFLSDIEADSTEMQNLAGEYPELVQELITRYLEWEHASINDIPDKTISIKNKASGSAINLINKPAALYSGKGPVSLIDGQVGTRDHSDGFWLGIEQKDMIAVLDLKSSIGIKSIRARFLNEPDQWIFCPTGVQVEFSNDGKTFSGPKDMSLSIKSVKSPGIYEASFRASHKSRYIRLSAKNIGFNPDWHANPGGKAWIFCDEIIVE